jgi:hypothetical protein
MATFYVKYRKIGPTGVFSVIANNREQAVLLVKNSAAAGEEFDIWDVNTSGYSITSTTGPTGATGL